MNGLSSHTDAAESLIAQLADEYAERLERGERPDIEEYVSRWPGDSRVLRQVLASLELVRLSSAGEIGDTALDTAEAARQLGDFRLLREIGRGGMGVVYEAEQVSLGRRVALKILPFAGMLDPRQIQRFKNEALAAAQLDHPNIVDVLAVGCERGVHFYAMRLIEGLTLAQTIAELRRPEGTGFRVQGSEKRSQESEVRSGVVESPPTALIPALSQGEREERAPENEAVVQNPKLQIENPKSTMPVAGLSTEPPEYYRSAARVMADAAEALDHAHQAGVVHRDVKPSNLMLDSRGKVWITDFGLARVEAATEMTMTGDVLGTLRYMSPEQASGNWRIVDHRTDVYSLGATLYELLTLRPAFTGSDRRELLGQIAEAEPLAPRRLRNSVPLDLETIALKALEKEPSQRYATAAALAEDLRCFVNDKPIYARRPGLPERARRWSRRHRLPIAAAIVVTIALASAAAVLAYREHAWTAASLAQANNALTTQKRLTKKAEDEKQTAAVERERAEQNLQRALLAFNDVAEVFRRPEFRDNPQLVDLQIAADEQLIPFYERYLEGEDSSATTIEQRAVVNARLAQMYPNKPSKAEELFQQSIALWDDLAARFPDEPRFAKSAAELRIRVAVLHRFDAASLPQIEIAAAVWERWPPNTLEERDAYHDALICLRDCLEKSGRLEDAIKIGELLNLKIAESLEKEPRNKNRRMVLMAQQRRLAQMLEAMGKPLEAQAAFAATTDTLMATPQPDQDEGWRHTLAQHRQMLANHYARTGDVSAAERELLEAISLREAISEESLVQGAAGTSEGFQCFALLVDLYRAHGLGQRIPAIVHRAELAWQRMAGARRLGEMGWNAAHATCDHWAAFFIQHGLIKSAISALEKELAALQTERFPTPQIFRTEAITLRLLGELNFAIGDRIAAEKYFRRSLAIYAEPRDLEIKPSVRLAKEMIVNAHLGVLLSVSDRADEARPFLDKAQQLGQAIKPVASSEERGKAAIDLDGLAFACQGMSAFANLLYKGDKRAAVEIYRLLIPTFESFLAELVRTSQPSSGVTLAFGHCLNQAAWIMATAGEPEWRNLDDALKWAVRATELVSSDANSWNTLGAVEVRRKNWPSAIRSLDRAIELTSVGTAADFFLLVVAHAGSGQFADANNDYAKGLERLRQTAPSDDEVMGLRLDAAKCLLRFGEDDNGDADRSPLDERELLMLAQASLQRQRDSLAVLFLERASVRASETSSAAAQPDDYEAACAKLREVASDGADSTAPVRAERRSEALKWLDDVLNGL